MMRTAAWRSWATKGGDEGTQAETCIEVSLALIGLEQANRRHSHQAGGGCPMSRLAQEETSCYHPTISICARFAEQ